MARTAKNEKALTPEEKLAQALVPDVEQLYRVPDNWCWGYLTKSFAECKDSYRKPINAAERAGRIGIIPYYGATGQVGWIDDYLTDEELVLLGEDGTPFLDLIKNKAYLISGKAWVNNHAHILKSFFGRVGNIYLLHYLNAFNYTGYVNGTTRLKLTQSSMDTIPIPIAPLAEQQRIVDRIESLFAKLDEAKEKAQAVVDGFEDRRAAILHKAFTGELTRTWAAQQGISLDAWQTKRFDNVAEVKSNLVDPAEYPDFPHIAPDNIEKKTGKLLDYHTVAEDAVKSGKHRFYAGQILYSKIRPNLSKVVVIDFDGLCSADMYPIEPRDGVNTKFLWYYMLSDDFVLQASTAGSRSVLPKINQKELASLNIQITDLNEQEKVVAVLDKLFEKEQEAKEAAEQVIDQIDTMKKSILVRAFRGELGTNDPADESAVELLKQVLRDDVPAPQRAKPVTIPKELSKSLRNDLEKKIIKLYFQRDTTALSVKEIMSVSSKTFDVLDCLRILQNRQIITKQEDGNYRLMG